MSQHPPLPIDDALPALLAALETRTEAVLAAPPGAGKTTRVPLALLDASWRGDGKIVVLSPRRIAARAAAARMAATLGEPIGARVGFRVRLESRVSAATRIEVVTEGVFTRMILSDPGLTGISAVLFDEFHERSLEGDLALALAREAQQGLREDLRLLVMSATLDTARIAALLGDAPVIASEGRMFPVAVKYRPRGQTRLEEAVAEAARVAMNEQDGSALVFLPGVRDIERAATALASARLPANVDVRPLYGALSPREQDDAIAPAPAGRRKIVLSTAIAETSLTIEDVRIVIDAGLSRRARYEPGIGLTRLETVRASQAAITQRAGRAGRVARGACYRLWDEGETRALPAFDRPEMLDADLTSLALDLAAWRARDPNALAWLDPPPALAWNEAQSQLKAIDALDESGAITPHGAALARLPLPPALAHMVLAADDDDVLLAARVAVLLTEQGLAGREPDLRARLDRLAEERSPRAQAARGLADRIVRQCGRAGGELDASRAGAVLALAFPDRVAKARGNAGTDFLMANGRAVTVDQLSPLARERYLVVADATGQAARAFVQVAAPISEAEIEAAFGAKIHIDTSATYDANAQAMRARRKRVLGAITLSEGPLDDPSIRFDNAWRDLVARDVSLLPWDDDALQLRARIAMLRERFGEDWPDWSDAALAASVADWLPSDGVRALRQFEGRLRGALEAQLSYAQKRQLEDLTPTHFETPADGRHRIDYRVENGPAVELRLQELFGMAEHPAVMNGEKPLLLLLTSPAGRPVQTTRDLPGFWRGSYAAVRADLRGRYPKHPWPEDPLTAAPTRRAKPRGT